MELSMMTFMLEFPVLFFKQGSKEEKMKEIESFIDLTAETGYKNIDLIWQTIELAGKDEIKRMLDKHNLKLNCIIYMDVAVNDESTPDVIAACEFFGCKKLMLVPGLVLEDRNETFKAMVKNYTRAVNMAAEKGIVCVCEDDPNINIPCGTRAELDALLDAVPGLKVVYDSANMYPSCDTAIPYYEYFADRIAHIHIKDVKIVDEKPEEYANPGLDGRYYINAPHMTGDVDFDALFDAIKASGYKDTLAIEFVPMPGMDLAEDMKRVFDEFAKRV